eukprot:TRINITY_DN123793_c0_g1_i1.p1 TRINITY_DN123793_c0_g1~~TRINITY_DN123793_c0_g1_i1.p1  ORF type:complete len:257 (-),score=16.04 TRINITY_DN123793_c0_g1_i1:295-1065(-)
MSGVLAWPLFHERPQDVRHDALDDQSPFRVIAWGPGWTTESWEKSDDDDWSVFGVVYHGEATLVRKNDGQRFKLTAGMYFAAAGRICISGGCGMLFLGAGPETLFTVGGPTERGPGKLPYIDGCTDTLLLPPVVKGAACLNYLYFPPGVTQTQHTHPSGRAGLILRGTGRCRYNDGEEERCIPLQTGTAFVIPAGTLHSFETLGHERLSLVAFHPDSTFGPSACDHPMINSTIVDGVSAATLNKQSREAMGWRSKL